MDRLDYIVKVWDNLESSYQAYSSKNAISRREYLCRLIEFNKTDVGVTVLEEYLSDEISTYSADSYAVYENMLNLFNNVFDRLKALGDQEISSFDAFLHTDISSVKKADYHAFKHRSFVEPEIALQSGFLLDSVMSVDGTVKVFAIRTNPEYLIIRNPNNLQETLSLLDMDNAYDKAVYAAIKLLAVNKKLDVPLVIMSDKYFSVQDSSFRCGKIKHQSTVIDEDNFNFTTMDGVKCSTKCHCAFFRMKAHGKMRAGYITVIGVEGCGSK